MMHRSFFDLHKQYSAQAHETNAKLDNNIQTLTIELSRLSQEQATLIREYDIANSKYSQDKAAFNEYKEKTKKNEAARAVVSEKLRILQAGLRETAETLPTLIVGKNAQLERRAEENYEVEAELSDEENDLFGASAKRKINVSSKSNPHSLYQPLEAGQNSLKNDNRPFLISKLTNESW